MSERPLDPGAKGRFLFPRKSYFGEPEMENIVFDANLQEFAQRIGYICSLENGGKISPSEAYDHIKELYKRLRDSKRNLGIGRSGEKHGAEPFADSGTGNDQDREEDADPGAEDSTEHPTDQS